MLKFCRAGNSIMPKRNAYLFFLLLLCSCTIVKKWPKDRPIVGKNSFEVKGGNFTNIEKSALLQRLNGQLDDSSVIRTKDVLFLLHKVNRPPAYDSMYSNRSANNMKASLFHLGYYSAAVSYTADTSYKTVLLSEQFKLRSIKDVNVAYTIDLGNPTTIDTVSYRLKKPELQELAMQSVDQSLLREDNPITKVAVLNEVSRLVDTFRNNGYYKFTAAELKVRGDTTIEALTSSSDDPFEQLQLLAEAQLKKDSPQIKIAIVLNTPQDSTKLNQYKVNDIYVLEDYQAGDDINDRINITERRIGDTTGMNARQLRRIRRAMQLYPNRVRPSATNFILRYHKPYIRSGFLSRNITLRKDSIFRQDEYYKTLANLAKAGVWQSVNIQTLELQDSNKVNLIVELVPTKKFGFETALEASYSAVNNASAALGGNLFGTSLNFSLINRNIGREAIRMTHSLRGGIELNNNSRSNGTQLINSTELSYSNAVVFPRILTFIRPPGNARPKYKAGETFINTNFSYTNRLRLFNLQSVNLTYGTTRLWKQNRKFIFKPFNAEFSYLYNQQDSFTAILAANPFLNYSYNTAFIVGMGAGYESLYKNPRHLLSLSKERSFKTNIEESGLTWGAIPVLQRYKKKYVKVDAEYKYAVNYLKTAMVFRLYSGVGIPLFKDQALPFFKQYFGGGSYSMRGWPVRGIGRGGQQLAIFSPGGTVFNDRTGDIQIEGNMEYRYDIARIIPNTLTLRGALFVDAGNIWNLKNAPAVGQDSAQFKFSNLYKQLGVSAGTGLRLDFNYFVLRIDLGFRFKRPETSYINNGWKLPPISFNDVLGKLFARGENDEYRKWRYENFNLTIGIGFPF